jgi:hypothetical protein
MKPFLPSLVAIGVALLQQSIGCSKREPPLPSESSSGVSVARNASAPSVSVARLSPAASTSTPVPDSSGQKTPKDAGILASEEQKRATDYARALGRGRRATVAKDWQNAIDAFTLALTLEPRDGKALAERGYARLSADDLEGARTDLEHARRLPTDLEVLASTLHNLGLLEERSGHRSTSDELKAQAKRIRRHVYLAKSGKVHCPMKEDSVFGPEVLDSFMAVAAALDRQQRERSGDAPKHEVDRDESAAQYRLTQTRDPKTKLFLVREGDPNCTLLHLVVRRKDGKLAAFWSISEFAPGLCGGGIKAHVTATEPPHVVAEQQDFMRSMCGGETQVHNCCVFGEYRVQHFIYDFEHDRMVTQLVETQSELGDHEGRPSVEVFVQDGQVTYVGAGCNQRRTFEE